MDKPADAIVYLDASIDISASPDAVYDVVTDISRVGEWSPEATGGRWIDDGTGKVGDWFSGDNSAGGREWTRECEVMAAERGRDFTFVVGGAENNRTWWSYEMAPSDSGTTLKEKWWVVEKPPIWLDRSEEDFQQRVAFTLDSILQTLDGIKAAAESG